MEATNSLSASNLFILIENPGVAAPEAFTLLGASNKEGTDAIGQFGSGTKHGTLVCLRKDIPPTIFCGNLKLEFGTRETVFEGANQRQVQVRVSGKDRDGRSINRTELLSFVLRFGQLDWKDRIELALREFVSNALDAVNGDASQIRVSVVDTAPRAKAGTTRVYIPWTEEGQAFVNDLSEWFLQFDGSKVWRDSSIIWKNSPSKAKVYRRGVLVRTVESAPNSLFDYNLNDLPLDESRIASDYYVKYYAGHAFRNSTNPAHFARVLSQGKGTWESSFDLKGEYDHVSAKQKAGRVKVWEDAVANVIPADAVVIHEEADDSLAVSKGYKVVRLSEELYNAAREYGVRTVESILTLDERNGRQLDEECSAQTDLAKEHTRTVWAKLEEAGSTKGEPFPKVRTFSAVTEASDGCFGFYRDGTVFINNRGLSQDLSPELFSTILEECAHYITKATDNSRDFQAFFINLLVKVWHG